MINVVTHNGIFHADEVFAVSALSRYYGKMSKNLNLVRTRDSSILAKAKTNPDTIVIDVGGEYDKQFNNYDHHQRANAPTPRENGVPYSSFGLIWKHFGSGICQNHEVAEMVDRVLVQKIDALDCGYGERTIDQVTASDIISWMNPIDGMDEEADDQFDDAVSIAQGILNRAIRRAFNVLAQRNKLIQAIESAEDERLIVLDQFVPGWQEIVLEKAPNAIYLIHPDVSGEWRLQAIPPEAGSFAQKKPLPAQWVDQVHPVPDFVFCHKGLFIAGAKSKAGILEMAKIALTTE